MAAYPEVTRPLAEWAKSVSWEAQSEQRRNSVINAFIDTVGVTINGAAEPEFQAVEAFIADGGGLPSGQAQVWHTGRRTNPATAAFVNGVAAHLMDFDDIHYYIHGHPSAVLVPALLAAGQHWDIAPRQILKGYVAGLGIMAAAMRLYGPEHYSRGWHSTSSTGGLACAVGIAAALDLGIDEMITAMGAGVSMSMGVRANFGSLMKPMHAALAARAGVEAVQMAKAGVTTSAVALEGKLGGIDVFADGSWPRDYADPVGIVIETADTAVDGLGMKIHPSCRGGHYAIDATLDAIEGLESVESVKQVRVTVPLGSRTGLIHDDPQSGLEAKFSLPYAVANTVAHGAPIPAHFTDAAVFDPSTRAIMDRLVVETDTSLGDLSATMDGRYAKIEILTQSGAIHSARVDDARGSSTRPLTNAEVDGKFAVTSGVTLSEQVSAKLLAQLRDFENLPTTRELLPEA